MSVAFLVAAGASANPVVVAAIGDYATSGSGSRDVANLVKSWNPDFVITLGDNNYGYATDYDRLVGSLYHDFIYPYSGIYGEGAVSNRFFPCLGNHDSWDDSYRQAYADFFTLPGNERYYNFRRGPIEFFAVNSEFPEPDGIAPDSIQGQWLQTQLSNSSAPWRLVYFHTPPYSSGPHGYGNEGLRMRWPFAAWGASIVLSGHDHIYERLFTNDLIHLVNGLGGVSRYYIFTNLNAGSQVQYNSNFGALRIEATDTNIAFDFITIAGEIIDSVVMGSSLSRGLRILYSSGDQSVCLSNAVTFRVDAAGVGTLRYRWFFNNEPIPGETNSTYTINKALSQHEGQYRAAVSDDHDTLFARPGSLTLLQHPNIISQPESETVVVTSNLTLVVTATGCGALRYQWQHSGTNLPNATLSSFTISNAQSSLAGEYRVFVSDVNGSVWSDPAVVDVIFPSRFVQQPVSQAVVEGGDVTFSVAASGTLPISYEWRFGAVRLTNMTLNASNCFFTIRNVQRSQAGTYRVGVSNAAGILSPSGLITLTVLADNDHDQVADNWEAAYGFDTNNAADATFDADGDGMSNAAEYLAGTNPMNASSYLKIDARVGSGATLYFGAVAAKTYTIEYAESLPPVAWFKLVDIVARATNHQEIISDPAWTSRRFYRLATPRQP